jgi:hypothetical protein
MKQQPATQEQLEAGLAHAATSPRDCGTLEAIFIRPAAGKRTALVEARLSPESGVHGDRWSSSGANQRAQVTLMNARILEIVAGGRDRWSLAGDQLIVDLDLSKANLPSGQRLAIDDVELEVSDLPHTGCERFAQRFGPAAAQFINAAERTHLHLRGINAQVIRAGTVRVGSEVRKVS